MQHIDKIKELLAPEGRNVVILSHSNPDGDAIGSSLALARLVEQQGHRVTCAVPNRFPYFLSWMSGIERVQVYKFYPEQIAQSLREADLIFCLDFNTPARLEQLGDALAGATKAERVLIDHHPQPSPDFDLIVSDPTSSSTSFLIYRIIEQLYGIEAIDYPMAEALYVGMMTDTGNFSYGDLSPELFVAIGGLMAKGLDIPRINALVYSSFTESRMRLLGYALDRKWHVVEKHKASYISLSEAELRRFDFQVGDTEGFVNFPLQVGDMAMSAMFVQTKQFIRVSLRSRGDVDVNLFARDYFNGGGHRNAAGGKSFATLTETIDHYRASLDDFFAKQNTPADQ